MAVQVRFLESGIASSAPRENPLRGRTVVVVDDSRVQRKRLRELYESMGMKCVGEGENGLEGLTLAEHLRPDLVSLDILMPVMHGVEALGYIREAGFARFIVLVSAVPSLEDVARLRPMGQMPDAVFSKKDSRETFREVLSNILLADALAQEAQAKAEQGEGPDATKPDPLATPRERGEAS